MPVFTFEKISPPTRHVSADAAEAEKPRSVIVQFLDRFVEARAKRAVIAEKRQRQQRKPAK
jgi:hypothetical protein